MTIYLTYLITFKLELYIFPTRFLCVKTLLNLLNWDLPQGYSFELERHEFIDDQQIVRKDYPNISPPMNRKDHPKISQPKSPYPLRNRPKVMSEIAPVAPLVVLPPVVPTVNVPTAVTQVAFALTPGAINASNIINLSSKTGILAFNQATTSLAIPFDGNSKDVNLLQSPLDRRATNAGWNAGTGNILMIADSSKENKNILTEYGCLTEKEIKASLTFLDTPSRQAQNNQMMVECLLASLTEGCFLKISNEKNKYTIELPTKAKVKSAALLYKLLIQKAIVDTRATTYQFRSSLDNLENYMGIANSNIELFNMYVKNSREGLIARGETVDDLIMELFKGYKATSDTKSVEYIDKKKEAYLDGKDFEPDELMQVALNKYILRKENGEWGAPSADQI